MTEEKVGEDKIIVHVESDLEEIIPDFLDITNQDIDNMLAALEKDDFETLQLTGHTLKGSGGGYGFDTISEIGRAIEQAAKIKEKGEIEIKLKSLVSYMNKIEIVYD